ncbi:hypothetical protein ANO11243_000290 [Dothideomycetidae sp. 11243]|nr:hypothetical protein ANO11243_000290 [fungal sp. No.11243]
MRAWALLALPVVPCSRLGARLTLGPWDLGAWGLGLGTGGRALQPGPAACSFWRWVLALCGLPCGLLPVAHCSLGDWLRELDNLQVVVVEATAQRREMVLWTSRTVGRGGLRSAGPRSSSSSSCGCECKWQPPRVERRNDALVSELVWVRFPDFCAAVSDPSAECDITAEGRRRELLE